MSRAKLRPQFDLVISLPVEETMDRLRGAFEEIGDGWEGHVAGTHAQLVVGADRRHLWSPWLTFSAQEHDDGARLHGRFAPHHSIWTMYIAFYAIIIFSMLGLGFFGLSQWMAGQAPTMLWSLPVGLVLCGFLFLSAFVGQGLTAQQMVDMREFVQASLEPAEMRWDE